MKVVSASGVDELDAERPEAEVAAARGRHPSAGRWRIDIARAAAVVLRHGSAPGPWPQVAALVTAARGESGLAPTVFAERFGVEASRLEQIEAGLVGPADLPSALTRLPWWAPAYRQLRATTVG
jgi:hypothetical protein